MPIRLHGITFQNNLKGGKYEAVTKIRIGDLPLKTSGYFFSVKRFKELEIQYDEGNIFSTYGPSLVVDIAGGKEAEGV